MDLLARMGRGADAKKANVNISSGTFEDQGSNEGEGYTEALEMKPSYISKLVLTYQ